ncbi:hypothetical protein C7974DRAFT_385464 [Boeremia exigua]|uniref:uncharacterized protein n=1 Tax=Boeremia exigua TaxID=749465 RepID=UPI001E8E54CE|nr:uncharacterized protein C7974DRAFT_385464 [Boeremia exigua]KAH6642450.1 hypothetical protein C7974DRAFT_385464 [Boeremia exigua]
MLFYPAPQCRTASLSPSPSPSPSPPPCQQTQLSNNKRINTPHDLRNPTASLRTPTLTRCALATIPVLARIISFNGPATPFSVPSDPSSPSPSDTSLPLPLPSLPPASSSEKHECSTDVLRPPGTPPRPRSRRMRIRKGVGAGWRALETGMRSGVGERWRGLRRARASWVVC